MCGVHYDNRGGVFPAAETVFGLTCNLAAKGFSAEEADHQGACIQARPQAAVAADSGTEARPSFTEYNLSKVAGRPALRGCFDEATIISFGLLSHNQLSLLLLCYVTGAKWDLTEEQMQLLPLDRDGRLDLAVCASLENFVELPATAFAGL